MLDAFLQFVGEFCRACSPAPAEATSTSKARAAFRGMAGHCGFAGTAQVRPCSLGRRIHAAHTPQTHSAQPSTGSRGCKCLPTVGRHGVRYRCLTDFIHAWRGSTVEPRHAWMLFDFNSKCLISSRCDPREAWMVQPSPGNCRGRGGVGGQDRSVSCPPTPPRPIHRKPEPLWPLTLPLLLAGAGRQPCRQHPLYNDGITHSVRYSHTQSITALEWCSAINLISLPQFHSSPSDPPLAGRGQQPVRC